MLAFRRSGNIYACLQGVHHLLLAHKIMGLRLGPMPHRCQRWRKDEVGLTITLYPPSTAADISTCLFATPGREPEAALRQRRQLAVQQL